MDKRYGIFKSLEIIHNDDRGVITLEYLQKMEWEKEEILGVCRA